MIPFSQISDKAKQSIRYVLTDIDDTLTHEGRLVTEAFAAMAQLEKTGIHVVPITGRPAGWCDHIARMWPVAGLVGENGAFYFRYDRLGKQMIRRYWKTAQERENDRKQLMLIQERILQKVPGARVAADQHYRDADLAIDFCEDVPQLSKDQIQKIVDCFTQAGAQAKISSIHVNGWFGTYDKLAMSKLFFKEIFQKDLDVVKDQVLYIGDSPNDAPMFAFFKQSVGVANVKAFADQIKTLPTWITEKKGGFGFAEMVGLLLT